jgi:type II secretion system protein H
MNLLNQTALNRCSVKALQRNGAAFGSTLQRCNDLTKYRAFTLIELILVLAMLVIITSFAAPAMSRFIRGRALDTEARRMVALMHAAQSRAVSEGAPMVLWVNEKTGAYGLAAESSGQTTTPTTGRTTRPTTGQNGDPKAEDLMADSTLTLSVLNTGTTGQTLFNNLPAVRFQPDGTVDETSPQTLKLTDSDGFSRWLVETRLRTGYEIRDTGQ